MYWEKQVINQEERIKMTKYLSRKIRHNKVIITVLII